MQTKRSFSSDTDAPRGEGVGEGVGDGQKGTGELRQKSVDAAIAIYALKDTDIIGKLLATRQIKGKTFYLCQQVKPQIMHGQAYLFYSKERWQSADNLKSLERPTAARLKSRASDAFYGSSAWKDVRETVLQRDRHACQVCGATKKSSGSTLHVHHIIPRQGCSIDVEMDHPNNLLTLCRVCHPYLERYGRMDSSSDSGLLTDYESAQLALLIKIRAMPTSTLHDGLARLEVYLRGMFDIKIHHKNGWCRSCGHRGSVTKAGLCVDCTIIAMKVS